MRKLNAPQAGWYPDPENRGRLRWWDGLDWTDIRRAVPSEAELTAAERIAALNDPVEIQAVSQPPPGWVPARQDQSQLIAEVRAAARAEVDRAADVFTQRANRAVATVTPLITSYTNRLVRLVRAAVVIAIVLLVAYFVFQVVVQASFFEWLGDRIDNWTDDSLAPPGRTPGPAMSPV